MLVASIFIQMSATTPSESGALAAVFGTLFFFLLTTLALGKTELCKKFDVEYAAAATECDDTDDETLKKIISPCLVR